MPEEIELTRHEQLPLAGVGVEMGAGSHADEGSSDSSDTSHTGITAVTTGDAPSTTSGGISANVANEEKNAVVLDEIISAAASVEPAVSAGNSAQTNSILDSESEGNYGGNVGGAAVTDASAMIELKKKVLMGILSLIFVFA